jgi:hypothetical protein
VRLGEEPVDPGDDVRPGLRAWETRDIELRGATFDIREDWIGELRRSSPTDCRDHRKP